MGYAAAWGGLAPWGLASAIYLALYVFVSIVIGLVLAAVLMFLLAWVRDKAELIKKIRPAIDQVNHGLKAYKTVDAVPEENKLVKAAAQVPKIAQTAATQSGTIERKIEVGTARVDDIVIELHARAAMVKGIAQAFFLPGLAHSSHAELPAEGITLLNDPQTPSVVQGRGDELPPMEQVITIRQTPR